MKRPHRTLRIIAWLGLLVLVIQMWLRSPLSKSHAFGGEGWTVVRDIPYGERPGSPRLDLYLPVQADRAVASRPFPVLLALHGGSWTGGSKSWYGPQVAPLVRQGVAVIVPDYRPSRPGDPGWPGVLDELRGAVRWIRRHATAYGLDAGRIAALGSGAGGHLALLLGTAPPVEEPGGISSRVQAVIDLYGPTGLASLLASRGLSNDPIRLLLGGDEPRLLDSASPLAQVSADDPPTLIFHGLDDQWVPPEQSITLADRLASHGIAHRLVLVPGARHGFELKLGAPEPRDLTPEIFAFLETVWQAGVPDEPRPLGASGAGPAPSAPADKARPDTGR
jgi:acetyl esterase/lipase